MATPDWRPVALPETQRARAALLRRIREFFAGRGVLEVQTPVLSGAGTVDPNIDSWRAESAAYGTRWLHTSPEFAMKRLLAAGSGPIYQVAAVFRDGERGRLHNPEFTMLEWYRPGFTLRQLMEEVAVLVAPELDAQVGEFITYREAMQREAGVDPFAADVSQLRACLAARGVSLPADRGRDDSDVWLDLLMAEVVGPKLGLRQLCFVHDYPASQAALAKLRPGRPAVAERFELYFQGVELANGFSELADAGEQRRRFARDRARRMQKRQVAPPMDEPLLAALEAGLPDCAGVALGVDRLLMLKLGLSSVAETLAFPFDRA